MILLFGIISIGVKAATITLYWPVDLGIKINNSYSSSHLGVDFAAAKGSAVYAAAAGTVTIYDNGCTGSHYTDTDAWCFEVQVAQL